MNANNENQSSRPELKISGLLSDKGVRISERQAAGELGTRGYGTAENDELMLTFYEALYLLDKGMLSVKDEKGIEVDFQRLLQAFEQVHEDAWVKYLTYRDLRSRGYVVREGFGQGVDFRVYERGEYSKDTAKYLILSVQEGKPIKLEDLSTVMKQSLSLKKELVLAVMNRRGETVYYSVSQLTMK